ncbi:MAG: Hsp70 family protein, partial [Myxococcota bacterium]|nr:Hsp70 family protein [Myxococcota bacterium]
RSGRSTPPSPPGQDRADPTTPDIRGGVFDGNASLSAASPPARDAALDYVGLPPVRITDVTSHPLGMVVLDRDLKERVVALIPEATPLPCERKGRFAYAYDNMTAVRVEVTEGTGNRREDIKVIGEVILEDLPPRPKGTPIEVVYRYGLNQILEIDIVDVQTRRVRRARMDLKGALERTALEKARANVARFQVH